ncbi:hypothetical protein WH50_06415 [Pokkaliibacter plantistimulans]|uniref:Lysozyme inhibitor LprI N-terminal domain-containing protein n=1 Tax=Pokkaliibacter plantistimulans TaxID=1635171 RepID=A0ABX5M338_9GAMM|nr:hypothetical protein [Pokkaliibacter plantistimulans]PXF32088.1 hypothetical protein WH50_06415 [Pokkaliibacter plantistimulans]
MKYIVILLAFSAMSVSATPRDDYLKAGMAKCNKQSFDTVGDRMKCYEKVNRGADKVEARRGSNEYIKNNYNHLNKNTAIDTLRKIREEIAEIMPSVSSGSEKMALQREAEYISNKYFNNFAEKYATPWYYPCSEKSAQGRLLKKFGGEVYCEI